MDQYYSDNLFSEIASLKARLAALEKAVPAARLGSAGRAGATVAAGIAGDTPTAALPPSGDIQPVYFVEVESRDIYQGIVRVVEGKPRFYLQRMGRSRERGE